VTIKTPQLCFETCNLKKIHLVMVFGLQKQIKP
jgi:hypothetical protein